MAGQFSRKRKGDDEMEKRPKHIVKKFKKQKDYDSGSDDDDEEPKNFKAVNLQDSNNEELAGSNAEIQPTDSENDKPNLDAVISDSEVTDASYSDSEDEDEDENDLELHSNPNLIKKRKRNDPEAFATSMSKILGSKLSVSKRNDPVLSRSSTALQASKEITDQVLEKRAKHKVREEKRMALDKGRVKDVLGASAHHVIQGDHELAVSTAEIMEMEKRLRKIAQRGVVKLFNAVRAAQIKGEEATREAREKGLVGHGRRDEKVNEMSKKGFLDLIAAGGGSLKVGGVEEA